MAPETPEILLVDMGNQRLKWRWVHFSSAGAREPVSAGDADHALPIVQQDNDRLDGFVQRLSAEFSDSIPPARVVLSAVSRGEAVAAFRSWCRQKWDVAVENVASAKAFDGLKNDYDDPTQLGCDRWLAALAAHREIQVAGGLASVVVVDAGTAITVDLVHQDHFVGGVIMPGLSTMIRVLGRDTGQIRLNQSDGGNSNFSAAARNSDDAVRSGSYYAVCGGVDRCIAAQENLADEAPMILFTGGDAELVRDGSKYDGRICANLVLDGLAIIASGGAG